MCVSPFFWRFLSILLLKSWLWGVFYVLVIIFKHDIFVVSR